MNTTPKLDNILKYIPRVDPDGDDRRSLHHADQRGAGRRQPHSQGAQRAWNKKLLKKEWPIDKGLVSEAYCTSREKIANNPTGEPGHSHEFHHISRHPINNIIAVPDGLGQDGWSDRRHK